VRNGDPGTGVRLPSEFILKPEIDPPTCRVEPRFPTYRKVEALAGVGVGVGVGVGPGGVGVGVGVAAGGVGVGVGPPELLPTLAQPVAIMAMKDNTRTNLINETGRTTFTSGSPLRRPGAAT